jgi:hypothetical protein
MTEEQAYQYALDIFNQTVANLSRMADSARSDAIANLNNMQATSYDPTDRTAYEMTMNGMNQIGGISDYVFDTVGNASNYALDNSTIVKLQTEHTSIAGAPTQAPVDSFSSLFTHAVSDPGQFVHTNSTGFLILGVIFSLLLAKFIFLSR